MIRRAVTTDLAALAGLAVLMWERHTIKDLEDEFAEIIESDDAAFFIDITDGIPAGFAQCQLRHDYVEGTQSSPVGYLEGIFVKKEFRESGCARRLLKECEKWVAENGCHEFASDCELDNVTSLRFHLSVGFEEANRIICFRKNLLGKWLLEK